AGAGFGGGGQTNLGFGGGRSGFPGGGGGGLGFGGGGRVNRRASGAFRPEAPEPRQRMAPEGESADAEEDDTADAVNWSLPGIIPSLHARNASVSPLCNFMMKSAWFPSYRDCLAHSSVTGVTADWGDDDLFPRLNWLRRPNPEARTAAPDLLPRVDPYLQATLAAQAAQKDDPAAACLARIL